MATCGRCGTFACLECVKSVAGEVWCATCARRPVEALPVSELGVELVRVLATLAWALPPLALGALALGWYQRRRIQRGELAWSAEWHLRWALRRALFVLATWGLLAAVLVSLFLYEGASGGGAD